ncbi:MAG: ABC transporter ATP-binding protein [bacterium]
MAQVELRNVTKRFGKVTAVKDLSFDVQEGELLSILGPSGCGKTTTLRLLAGLELPDEGEILFDNQVVSRPLKGISPEKRNVGMVFQNLALWPHMTVYKNVEFGLKGARHKGQGTWDKSDLRKKVHQMLKLLGIETYANSYPHQLSGGERQRVALARALALEPKILLLDEPLSNLDEHLSLRLRDEIVNLHQRLGITTIYVTHDQGDALSVTDRVMVMNEGEIEQVDTPYEIYNRPATKFVASFIGFSNILEGKAVGLNRVETKIGTIECDLSDKRDKVTLLIRPENLRISNDGEILGKVGQGTFKGDRWLYQMAVNGCSLTVQTTERLEEGAEVRLTISSRPAIIED